MRCSTSVRSAAGKLSIYKRAMASNPFVSNNSLSNQVSEVQQSLRDNRDAASAALAVLRPDSISTVIMGRIKTSGRQEESDIQQVICTDSTMRGLVSGMNQQQQSALIGRIAQITVEVSEKASREAIKKAEDEIGTHLADPVKQYMQESIKESQQAAKVSQVIAAKAQRASGAMTQERSEAIIKYGEQVKIITEAAKEMNLLRIGVETIDQESRIVLKDVTMTTDTKEQKTSKLDKLRTTTETQRMAIYKEMIAEINGTTNHYGAKQKTDQKGLQELVIPKNLQHDKGQEMIENMEQFVTGRAEEYGWCTPEIMRIGKDLDANAGTYWKPPDKANGYADIDESYREEYSKTSKKVWDKLMQLIGQDLNLQVRRLSKYGMHDQFEFECKEYDGISAYFVLVQQNRVQDVEFRAELVKDFEQAAEHFAKGMPINKIEYLEKKLIDVERLGVKLQWANTGQKIATVMARLDTGYVEHMRQWMKPISNEDHCASEIRALFKDIDKAHNEIQRGDKLIGRVKPWRAAAAQDRGRNNTDEAQLPECWYGKNCDNKDCWRAHNGKGKGSKGKGGKGKGGKAGKGMKGGKGNKGNGKKTKCAAKGCQRMESKKFCDEHFMQGMKEGSIVMDSGEVHRFKRKREDEDDAYVFKQLSKKQKEGMKAMVNAIREQNANANTEKDDEAGPASSKKSVFDRIENLEQRIDRANLATDKRRQQVEEMLISM